MTPGRIQLRRTAGWRKPADAVVVTRPHSRFANPYRIGHEAIDAAEAVAMFGLYLLARPDLVAAARAQLRGRTLACWCRPGDPCHGDVLLGIANADVPGGGAVGKAETPAGDPSDPSAYTHTG